MYPGSSAIFDDRNANRYHSHNTVEEAEGSSDNYQRELWQCLSAKRNIRVADARAVQFKVSQARVIDSILKNVE